MRTFFRALRSIAAVTLFFFAWSFLPLWQAVAYAAAPEARKSGTRQDQVASSKGQGRPEERFEKALDGIRENVAKARDKEDRGEDDTRERDAIKGKRAEIESADGEFKKEFSATEKKLKDAKLPKEILDRHYKFVKHYEDNLKELRANLDDIDQAKTPSDRRSRIEKARLHLEKVKVSSKHQKLDPNKLLFRKIKGKERTPRLKQDEFEKDFPSKKKIKTASILQDTLAADLRRSTQILDSGFKSAQYRKPILVASNGSLAGLLPLNHQLPRTAVDKLPLPSVGEGWGEGAIPHSAFAIPNWEVQLAQAQDTPTSADLAETTEIQFTDAIRAKAQELGGNPVNIYEWVRNNIEFTPTYGSIQGADGCLETRTCNAYDTSSLLIALLRASNISSRYVYGTIEVPADRFMDWTGGFTDIQSAIRFVSSSGTPVAPVVAGNVISKVQLEHPWVEAWIDYNPSRGARHVTGDTWIPLDASYKQHTPKDGIDIAASVTLDSQAFLQALGAGATAAEATGSVLGGTCAASGQLMENYRILAGNYLSQQHPNSSAGDVLGGRAIAKQEFPYLLGTLPYRVYTAGVKSSEMPASLRNSINLRLTDAGIASIDITRSLPELASKQISIGFVPATQADQDTILRYLPQGSGAINLTSLPATLPAYLINVKPELRIDGIAVATGASIGLGKEMTLGMTIATPGQGADSATRSIKAGDYTVIMLETGATATERLSSQEASIDDTKAKLQSGVTTYTREDIVGNVLQAAGLAYSAERAAKRGILERSFNVRTMMQPSILLASSKLDTTLVFGLPHTARGKGISLDLTRDNSIAASRSGDLAAEKQYNITASLDASGLTSRVLDDLLGSQPATGAVRALQAAKGAGIPIHTINQANITSVLPLLSLDAETLSDIQNAVNAGLTIVTTRTGVAISGKTVTPLVLIDPLDGKSAWLLENELNGSMSMPGWTIQSPMMNLAWTGILPRLSPLSQACFSDNFAENFEAAVNGVATISDSVAGSSLGLLTQGIFYSAASNDFGCYLASTSAAPAGSCMASFSGSLCMADAEASLGTPNARPLANAGANRTVAVNSLVTLDGSGSSDQNNDALTYIWNMTAKPSGSSAILSSGSSISPAFTADLTGSYVVTLVVSDGKSYSAPASVTLTAAHPNVSVPNLAGKTQQEAEALIIASHLSVGAVSDATSDTVSAGKVLSQDPAPNAMTVKGSPVKIILSSGPAVDKEPPTLTATFDRTPAVYTAGDVATLYIDASDNANNVTVTVTVDNVARSATLPATVIGTASFTPGSVHKIEVTAADGAGNSAALSLNLGIMDPDKATGPEAEITTPARDAEISAPTQIFGTVQSQNLLQYTLSYAPNGSTTFTTFAEGTTQVTNGILGTLDPTLLKNGIYDIRLAVVDTNGRQYWVDRTYRITGDMKVGNFTVTFTDMSIPVAGLPVTVSRTYDSRDKSLRDFGIGWSVDIQNIKIDKNRTPGDGWPQPKSGGVFGQYCLTGDTEHYVTVNLPDGRSEEFDLTLTPSCQRFSPVEQTTPGFAARFGTTSKLVPKNAPLLYVANDRLIDPETVEPYDPSGYILTTLDGTKYELDQSFGVRKVTDPNGNTLTYSSDGVTHSAGPGLRFVRDGNGRIAQIIAPDGSKIAYTYNSKDELVSVTDQNGNITTYAYNRSHGLTSIKDPRGITPLKNEYDDAGRLMAHTDAYGKRIEYTHDVQGRQEVVKDRNGNLTVFIYDEKGRVLRKTDPLGNDTSFTYDQYGNKNSETDPLGNITRWTYDDKKNVLTEAKITSSQTVTTSHTYNALGKILTSTDPLGHVTSNTYDAKGNLLTTTDALGNVTTNTYDAKGNLKTTMDALNHTTIYEYDTYGNRTKQITAAGSITYWTYDAKGNKLSDTDPRGNTTLYSYGASGKLISTENAIGAITRTDYDTAGNKVSDTNPLGLITWFYYDSANRLVTTEYPDGTTTKSVYDNEGNRIASIDQDGRTTSYEYNGSKQLIKTIYADQTTRQFGYDSAGRQTTVTDALGNATTKVYDALGRVIANIDPELNSTTFEYDANGNQESQTDPNGHTTIFTYDESNRLVTTTLPGGQATTVGYDALGRKTSETDAAGNRTQFAYDAQGNLAKVTDAEGGITRYEYDQNNSRTAIQDARGNRTTFTYDTLNRPETKTMPNGGVESYAYDASGCQIAKTDAKNQTILYGYDDNGRLATRSYPDGSTVRFTYTNTGRRATATDSRGTTSYQYNNLNRPSKHTYSEGQYISYGYDVSGRIAALSSSLTSSITYTYYNNGRLKEVKDPQNNITSYTYDAAGSRTGLVYPNGTTVSYAYDDNNRLTNLTHRNSGGDVLASYAYALGAIGNRTRIYEANGISRQYTYDRLSRLKNETVTDPTNMQTYQNDYAYDAVGNRQNKTNTAYGQPVVSDDYTYNAADQLVSVNSATYAYDLNGNLASKIDGTGTTTYAYNYDDRLVQVRTPNSELIAYTYDADGNRTGMATATGTVKYLVDTNRSLPQVLAEYASTGSVITSYVYADDLVSMNRGNTISYYYFDGLGSTRLLTDATGTTTDTYEYDAFGNQIAQTGTTQTEFLFTGQQYDANLGLYYLRARYYQPDTGRFTALDPYQGDPYAATSLHRYLYANADPVNRTDPSGEMSLGAVIAVTALMSVVFVWGPLAILAPSGSCTSNDCFTCLVYAEAGGTNNECMKAVAWTIKNRMNDAAHFPGQSDACSVASASGQFDAYGTKRWTNCKANKLIGPENNSRERAATAVNNLWFDNTEGSTYFHDLRIKTPTWIQTKINQGKMDEVDTSCTSFRFYKIK